MELNVNSILLHDLGESLDFYSKLINNHNFNEAFNVMKNIQMIIQTLKDISDDKNMATVLDDLSKCWSNCSDKTKYNSNINIKCEMDADQLIKELDNLDNNKKG